MLCQWAGDLQDRSAFSSGTSSRRTTLRVATAIQLFRMLVLLAHLTASKPRRLVHSMPLFMISFLLLFLPFHTSYSPSSIFFPLPFFLASPFPQQTTSVSADPSHLLLLTVHTHCHRSTNCCRHNCLLIRLLGLTSIWQHVLTHLGQPQATLCIKQIQLDAQFLCC